MNLAPDVGVGVAFIAGFLSFISPCVLPLVPAYIGYLSNRMTSQVSMEVAAIGPGNTTTLPQNNRFDTILHGIFFVAGFTLVFVGFGLLTNASLNLLRARSYDIQLLLAKVGGLVVIFFGLHVMGATGFVLRVLIDRIAWNTMGTAGTTIVNGLERLTVILFSDTRRQMNPHNSYGYAGSIMMGVFFAAGWSPCIGAIYGSILTLAANGNSTGTAGVLLFSYSLGLGVPFLLTAAGLDRMRGVLKRLQRHMRMIEIVSGAFLIFMGYLLFSGQLTELARLGGGFADFANNVGECVGGWAWGRVDNIGACMDLGPNYKEILKKRQDTPANYAAPKTQPQSNSQGMFVLPVGMSSMLALRRFGGIALIMLMVAACGGTSAPAADGAATNADTSAEVSLEIGKLAPNFTADLVSGSKVSLESLRGRVVLLNFWATWCGPCRHEMPDFQRVVSTYDKKDFQVIAINYLEKPDTISKFTDSLGLKFDVALDLKGEINRLYGVNQYPVSYVIGRDGKILARQYGPFTPFDAFEQALKKWTVSPGTKVPG